MIRPARTSTYLELLRLPTVRRILVSSLLLRAPFFAAGVILVLHVVSRLHRSYVEAGLVETVFAIALAISNPWRGRRLDRVGLRRAILPSIVALAVVWSIAPWVPFVALLPLVAVGGLFMVPQFSIVRLVLIGAAGPGRRTAVLSLDSVVVELTFMIGPVAGVLAGTTLPTPIALMAAQGLVLAGAIWLWIDDPPLGREEASQEPVADVPRGTGAAGRRLRLRVPAWLGPATLGVLLTAVAATVALQAEDLGTVAALRSWHHTGYIGWVLAVWGLGSALGGLLYGTLPRHPPSWVLMALLALSTALVAVADDLVWFVALLFLSGFFCAPTLTATVADLAELVPARNRGEAMGWQGSANTLGGAIGAPVAGAVIDAVGWQGAFLAGGAIGLLISVLAMLAVRGAQRAAPVSDAGDPVAAGRFGDG